MRNKKFKVGDRVRSHQPRESYTGVIAEMEDKVAWVLRDDLNGKWECKIVGDKIATANGMWDDKPYLEFEEENYQGLINSKKIIMSKITKFVKELALSADEKVLRKQGFKNDCGEYTDEAKEFAMQKLCQQTEKDMVTVAKALEAEKE